MLINTHSSALHHVLVLGLVYHNHTSDLWGNLGVLKNRIKDLVSFVRFSRNLANLANFTSFCY